MERFGNWIRCCFRLRRSCCWLRLVYMFLMYYDCWCWWIWFVLFVKLLLVLFWKWILNSWFSCWIWLMLRCWKVFFWFGIWKLLFCVFLMVRWIMMVSVVLIWWLVILMLRVLRFELRVRIWWNVLRVSIVLRWWWIICVFFGFGIFWLLESGSFIVVNYWSVVIIWVIFRWWMFFWRSVLGMISVIISWSNWWLLSSVFVWIFFLRCGCICWWIFLNCFGVSFMLDSIINICCLWIVCCLIIGMLSICVKW